MLACSCGVFILWLACPALSGAATDTDSTDSLTAQRILDRMATIYATCKTYRDSGVVTNDFGSRSGSSRHVDVKPFHTAFIRAGGFRYQFDQTTPDKPYIIWAKERDVRTWWHVKPGVEKQSSLADAVAGATGVSSGSAHTIPTLLLPDSIGGRKLTAMTDLKRLPDEAVDKTPCFKLEGKFANTPTTLWLDQATFLLVRMVRNSGLALATTVYQPQINIEILARDLEFNAPKGR